MDGGEWTKRAGLNAPFPAPGTKRAALPACFGGEEHAIARAGEDSVIGRNTANRIRQRRIAQGMVARRRARWPKDTTR